MTPIQALFLGLLQGVTELLPISSSGHLVLAETFFRVGIPADLMVFDVLLHVGSLLALFVCFPRTWGRIVLSPLRRDRGGLTMLLFLIIGTIPAAVLGLLFSDFIEGTWRTLPMIGGSFLFTALVLVLSETVRRRRPMGDLRLRDALLVGIGQALALPPGISRSGLTIAAGRCVGLSRKDALDFSFLLAVPVIAGAAVMALTSSPISSLPPLPVSLAGALASFGTTILSIFFLRGLVSRFSLAWFALYLVPLGVFALLQ